MAGSSGYPEVLDTDSTVGKPWSAGSVLTAGSYTVLCDAVQSVEGWVGTVPAQWPMAAGAPVSVANVVSELVAGGAGAGAGYARAWENAADVDLSVSDWHVLGSSNDVQGSGDVSAGGVWTAAAARVVVATMAVEDGATAGTPAYIELAYRQNGGSWRRLAIVTNGPDGDWGAVASSLPFSVAVGDSVEFGAQRRGPVSPGSRAPSTLKVSVVGVA